MSHSEFRLLVLAMAFAAYRSNGHGTLEQLFNDVEVVADKAHDRGWLTP